MLSPEDASALAVDRALVLLGEPRGLERTYKTDRDYATSTDFAIEDALRGLLARLTPAIGFLGEERGHTGSRDTYWCLDPIDGTTNFSRGLPTFGVSLALIVDNVPVHGEIALPALGQRYATKAGKAYRDGQEIHASGTSELSDALVTCGDFATGEGSRTKNQRRIAIIAHLANMVGRVRMLGTATTDFAWLASGHVDAVILDSNHPWDVSAGVAIAQAAGAIVSLHDGTPYSLQGPNVIAATPALQQRLVRALTQATSTPPATY